MTRGTCLCGAVRYEVDGPFNSMVNCHCSMCRKHHGSAYGTFTDAPLAGFRWLAGASEICEYESSPQGRRSFCQQCGSVTPMLLPHLGIVLCPAGSLEGDLDLKPQAHWFVGSKASWYTISDTLPQHEAYPPEFGATGFDRSPVPSKPGITPGSCLCGDVTFELEGAPFRMWYCHCSRCRRSLGTPHGANVFYKADQLSFTHGADGIVEYKVPEARLFGTAFCRRCGSAVPRVYRERGIAVVPGGSLDVDPGIRAMAHIFVGSKANWEEITDDIPQYAEIPPKI